MALTKVEAEQLQAAQTNITSVGTLTTLTVDDITINGSTISDAADLTVDVGGNINLDADGGYIILKDGGTTFGALGLSGGNFQIKPDAVDQDIIFSGNDGGSAVTALTLDMSEAGAATFNNTVTSTKFIADQFTSASGDVTFRRGGSSTARLLIESGTTTSGQNFTVTGTNTATTFTDGYVTWNLAQFNRYGAALELQYAPTNSATLVKIGANGSNPTIFNAYSGDASFSGDVGIGNSNPQRALQVGTYGTGNGEIAIASSTTGFGSILFGDSASGTALYDGYLQYQHDDRELLLGAGAIIGAKINSSGDLTVTRNIVTTGTVMATDNASITNQTDMQLALRDSDNTNMRANFMVEKAANSNRGGLGIQATESGVSNDRDIYLQPAGGRVGILTAAPAYGLDVNTTSRFVHNLTAEGNIITADVKARTSGGLSLQTDDGTKRLFINDDGKVGISEGGVIYASRFSVGKPPSRTPGSVFTSSPSSFFSEATLGGTTGNSQKIAIFGGEDASNVSGLAIYRYRRATGTNWLTDGFSLRQEVDNSAGLYYYMNFAGGKVGIGDTAPFSTLQVGSNTFSGSNGMYADSRVGISNHGALTGLMLATTYNDANYPDYGVVFVAGPSTSSYNCWNIAPDGPAKGNRLNFHYQAQSSNIHVAPRMASLDGSGNFYPAGDVVMAQGKGIQFVNQADFATGETVVSSILDDYEEGRFDPYIGGSSNAGTWTSNNANGGYYIKVGRMVQVWINATGSLSGASGYMRVYGLPFTCASNIAAHAFNAVYSSGSLQYWSGSGADVMGPLTYPSTRYLYFHTYNGSSTGQQPAVTNGGHNLHCCAVYYTS